MATTANTETRPFPTEATLPADSKVMINDDGTFRHGKVVSWVDEDNVEVKFANFAGTHIVSAKHIEAAPDSKTLVRNLLRQLSDR